MIHYGMTKTAQVAVARGLAELTAGSNVTVNSVLAGPTSSEGVEGFIKQMAAEQKMDVSQIEKWFFKEVRPSSLIKRFEKPEEIASVVAFLCSPLASAINGAAIRAEGGVVKTAV
jgi:NAD(P)-dependent dehydrogenase (short-subunit alcohol dehydrogenase family)